MDDHDNPKATGRTGRARLLPLTRRQSLVSLGVAGLTGGFLLVGNALAAPTAISTTTSTQTATGHSGMGTRGGAPFGPGGAPFGPGRGRPGGPGGLTVSAISGNTITAKRPEGSTQTITVTSSTVYTVAGTPAQLSDIKSGAQIHALGTLSNGTLTATHIDIVLPHLGGKLTAISGSTLTVTDRAGTARKVIVSAATTYQRSGVAINISDLQVGNQIDAVGSLNSDGSLAARVVHVILPAVDGAVTAVNGSTITVQARGPNAGTKTITVNGSTTYTLGGPGSPATGSLSNVQVGGHIHAEGTLNSSGMLLASAVHINLPAVDGAVTAVSANSITVQARGPQASGTRSVMVSSSTVYLLGGPASSTKGSLADVKSGVHIHAEGTLNANGSLNAATVRIMQPPPTS
ncbi:MAG TPA: DUF5666 domain-containing protein [Chloroflexota bacterium]